MNSSSAPDPAAFAVELGEHVVAARPGRGRAVDAGHRAAGRAGRAARGVVQRGHAVRVLGRRRPARGPAPGPAEGAALLGLRADRRRRLPHRRRAASGASCCGSPATAPACRSSSTGRPTSAPASRSPSARTDPSSCTQESRSAERLRSGGVTGTTAASESASTSRTARASSSAWSRTCRRGSGTASQGSTTAQPAQPRVGEHLGDGRPVAAGDDRPGPGRPASTRTAWSAAASYASRACLSRRRANRCWLWPPALVRPCT